MVWIEICILPVKDDSEVSKIKEIIFLICNNIILQCKNLFKAPDRNPENIKIQGHLPHQMDISWEVRKRFYKKKQDRTLETIII